MASHHDIQRLPTFCAVAGISDCATSGPTLDGVDVSAVLFKNASGGHDYVLYGQHDDAPNSFKPFDDAIRDKAGWKLIQGTGGKPSSWSSQPPKLEQEQEQECSTANCLPDALNPYGLAPVAMKLPRDMNCSATEVGVCYQGNDLTKLSVDAPGACCAACTKQLGCVGWTFHPTSANFTTNNLSNNCYLKKKMNKKPNRQAGCVSGGAVEPPPAPGPPSPAPGPPPPVPPSGASMLFNVMADPGEHDDVSAANPTIVARLTSVLNGMRATASGARNDHLNCTGSGKVNVPGKGTYVSPSCTVLPKL